MPRRVPLATYRLQFNSNFRFVDAIPILDYLRDLGISHLYASPILASRHGSGHGYDVTDPTSIDLDLGGEEGFAALQSALEQRDMGLLLDIVPNHMAASSENRWWMDVLEHGPDSLYSSYFDIDWNPPARALKNKLLLPFLGKPFGEALNDGDLKILWHDARFVLQYGEQVFPLAPHSYAEILGDGEAQPHRSSDADSQHAQEWQGILAVAHALSLGNGASTLSASERRTKFENMHERLRHLLAASPETASSLESTLQVLNGAPGSPRTFAKLEHILSGQHYRLAFWQTLSETINYRRFFSITDLVGVRVEDPSVFDATHELAIRIALKSPGAGFRIDHIDGLRDPLAYLNRLRERLSPQGPEQLDAPYLVVEKILARNEWLPEGWPVDGTTGYEYLNFANRLLADEKQSQALEDIYARWTGLRASFDDILYDKKKLVMRTLLGVEIRALGRELAELARDDRYARELHPAELAEALVEVTACLPVYRTYIQTLDIPDAAKKVLSEALESARARRSTLAPEYFDFLSDVLLLAAPEHVSPEQREARLAFVTRWQQFTGSIMAKGFEDTALYVYFPLASLNEVGGDPRVSATVPLAFHPFISARRLKWPSSMNATTTHDTKRSEDTRARIAVLSEIPEKWEAALHEWSRQNHAHVNNPNGAPAPDRNEEYLFYQTLVGAWPLTETEWPALIPRLQDYIIKATREANIHTRWSRPNEAHESALRDFVAKTLDRRANAEFCAGFEKFHETIASYGMLNGLAQTLLKATCPGVPDCYQGSEFWDLRLVDPDNRGLVDFEQRRAALAALQEMYESSRASNRPHNRAHDPEHMLASWRDACVKLHVLVQSLRARRANPQLFLEGDYQPLAAGGPHADRIVAFARAHEKNWIISLTTRRLASLQAPIFGQEQRRAFWNETAVSLPENAPANWINVLAPKSAVPISIAGGRLHVADAFAAFPLALLIPAAHA